MLFLILLSFATLTTSTATCYFPGGKVSDGVPCNNTTTGHSACCALGHLCMSSGLCFNKGLIARDSCTDATWKDDACAQSCVDWNPNSGCAIIPQSWITTGVVETMKWCCDFPLANGSCAQGFDINVQAGTVLEDNTVTSGTAPAGANVCQTSHDVAVGLGVGIPTLTACISILLLYLRERRARRKEKPKPASLKSDEAPWIKHGAVGHSVTTITSDEPPWIKNRVGAYAGPNVPHIELEEISWRRELP